MPFRQNHMPRQWVEFVTAMARSQTYKQKPILDPLRSPQVEIHRSTEIIRLQPVSPVIWYLAPCNDKFPVLIFFHGRSGHWTDLGTSEKAIEIAKNNGTFQKLQEERGYRLRLLRQLGREVKESGAGFMVIHHSGFGEAADAKPSDTAFEADVTAIANALRERGISGNRVAIIGESLGTTLATRLAAKMCETGNAPNTVTLIAPLMSTAQCAKDKLPNLLLSSFFGQRLMRSVVLADHLHDNVEALGRIAVANSTSQDKPNIIIAQPTADKVIKPYHSDRLYQIVTAREIPAKLIKMHGVGHMDWNPREILEQTMVAMHSGVGRH